MIKLRVISVSCEPPTDDINAAVERHCIGAFGFHWNGRPHFPEVSSWLPTLDLICGQFSIWTTTDHVDPSVKGGSSKGADAYSKRRRLQVQEESLFHGHTHSAVMHLPLFCRQ